jgi:hypothetical protein
MAEAEVLLVTFALGSPRSKLRQWGSKARRCSRDRHRALFDIRRIKIFGKESE